MKLSLILTLGIAVLLPTASSHAGWVRADGLDNYGASLVLAVKDKYQNKHEKKQAKKQRKRENEENNAPAAESPPPSDSSGKMNDNVLWGDYQYTNPPKQ